jgi:hypothetical protein
LKFLISALWKAKQLDKKILGTKYAVDSLTPVRMLKVLEIPKLKETRGCQPKRFYLCPRVPLSDFIRM